MKQLHSFFKSVVEVPRIRVGRRRTIETLIREEALLLAKFLTDRPFCVAHAREHEPQTGEVERQLRDLLVYPREIWIRNSKTGSSFINNITTKGREEGLLHI